MIEVIRSESEGQHILKIGDETILNVNEYSDSCENYHVTYWHTEIKGSEGYTLAMEFVKNETQRNVRVVVMGWDNFKGFTPMDFCINGVNLDDFLKTDVKSEDFNDERTGLFRLDVSGDSGSTVLFDLKGKRFGFISPINLAQTVSKYWSKTYPSTKNIDICELRKILNDLYKKY